MSGTAASGGDGALVFHVRLSGTQDLVFPADSCGVDVAGIVGDQKVITKRTQGAAGRLQGHVGLPWKDLRPLGRGPAVQHRHGQDQLLQNSLGWVHGEVGGQAGSPKGSICPMDIQHRGRDRDLPPLRAAVPILSILDRGGAGCSR